MANPIFESTCVRVSVTASLEDFVRAFRFYQLVHPESDVYVRHADFGTDVERAAKAARATLFEHDEPYAYIGWPNIYRCVTYVSSWTDSEAFASKDDKAFRCFETLEEALSYPGDIEKVENLEGVYVAISDFDSRVSIERFLEKLIEKGVKRGEFGVYNPEIFNYVGVQANRIYYADGDGSYTRKLTKQEIDEITGISPREYTYPIAVELRGLPLDVIEQVIEKLAGIARRPVEMRKENADYGRNWDYAGVDHDGRGYFWDDLSNYGTSVTVLSASEFLSGKKATTQELSYPIAISLADEEVSESLAKEVIRKLLSIKDTCACELDLDECYRFGNWEYVGIDASGNGRYWDHVSQFSTGRGGVDVTVLSLSEFMSGRSDQKVNLEDYSYPIAISLEGLNTKEVAELIQKLRAIAIRPVEFDVMSPTSALAWGYVGVDSDGEGYFWDEVCNYDRNDDASVVTVLRASQVLSGDQDTDLVALPKYPIVVNVENASEQQLFEVVQKLIPLTDTEDEFEDYTLGDYTNWAYVGITDKGYGQFWNTTGSFFEYEDIVEAISFQEFLGLEEVPTFESVSARSLAVQLLEATHGNFKDAVELLVQETSE